MALLTFQKPDKVIMLESNNFKGRFEFRPLEPGFGITIGNALRRVLLASLEGFAIKTIKIEGVDHEFSSIVGVVEDVTDIVLNLKQVRFKQQIEEVDSEKVTVSILGQDTLTAGDFNKFLSSFQVLNHDLVICHLNPSLKLNMEIFIDKGRGYVLAEEHAGIDNQEIGLIALDSIFTPIKNVNYWVENFRVEQKTDYEKLIMEITTDGSISPKDALNEAARILIQHLYLFSDEKIIIEEDIVDKVKEMDESDIHMRQLLKTKLNDLDLSVRALNCLKAAEVDTLGQLVSYSRSDLLKFRNFGKKSLAELDELVSNKKLNFGMDTSKYNLDSE
jgi:DNA-directed RNA polymerase subunit alpha